MWLSRRDLGKLGAWMSPRFTGKDNHACQHVVAVYASPDSRGSQEVWLSAITITGTQLAAFGKPGRARAKFASCGLKFHLACLNNGRVLAIGELKFHLACLNNGRVLAMLGQSR
jgi:hypothetical protein